MKLLLGLDGNSARSHYMNALLVSPHVSEYDVIKLTDPVSLNIVDDAECEEIVVDHLHEFVSPHFVHQFFLNLMKKTGAGGTITFIGSDLHKICHGVTTRTIQIDETNKLLYGDINYLDQGTANYPAKKSILSASELREVLMEMGAILIEARFVDKYTYILKFTR